MTNRKGRLAGRLALITGASRGIGYQTALAFGREGAHVIAVARTTGGLEELDDEIRKAGGDAATLVPLDVTDFDAIDRLGAAIDQRFGRLDVFVGNAGILGGLSPLGHHEPKNFQKVFDVNVTANWRFIRAMDPLLRASTAGRAMFLSSGSAHSCRAFWGPYAASKAALEALARVYANECASTAICSFIVDPYIARTAMRASAMPGEDPANLPSPASVAEALVPLADAALPVDNGHIYSVEHKRWLTPQRPA
jgi:NAD(P)-dependent dehydrogenase (short-subunit alcohol dehydrogenase family)